MYSIIRIITVCICNMLAVVLRIVLRIQDKPVIIVDEYRTPLVQLIEIVDRRINNRWILGTCSIPCDNKEQRAVYIYEFQCRLLLEMHGINATNILAYIHMMIDSLAHEMRHAWQLQYKPDIMDFTIAYRERPHEEDARAFASKFVSILRACMYIVIGIVIGACIYAWI